MVDTIFVVFMILAVIFELCQWYQNRCFIKMLVILQQEIEILEKQVIMLGDNNSGN